MPDGRPLTAASPVPKFQALWNGAGAPDLGAFIRELGEVDDVTLVSLILVDQREQAHRGRVLPTEHYFDKFPAAAADEETAVDLIYNEYLNRERLGEAIDLETFLRRFPEHRDQLGAQIELHQLLDDTRSTLHAAPAESRTSLVGEERAGPQLEVGEVMHGDSGKYRVERLLGVGGMGEVYLARDLGLDRLVAIKSPRAADPFDTVSVRRMEREARVVARLKHPNICGIYAVGVKDHKPYLVLEYVEGETLESLLTRVGRLPQRQAVNFAVKIASALEAAHAAGIVHRDLKPANVMIDGRGEPIVMDFGLAMLTEANVSSITARGGFVGTPAYCSPEQLAGDRSAVTAASDIHSLGVLLYEMLTGEPTFGGPMSAVIEQVAAAERPVVQTVRPDVHLPLAEVCRRAMARSPKERFATMGELSAKLAELALNLPQDEPGWASAAPQGAATETLWRDGGSTAPTVEFQRKLTSPEKNPPRRVRFAVAAAIVLVAAIAAFAAWSAWRVDPQPAADGSTVSHAEASP